MSKQNSASFADYIMILLKWRRFIMKTLVIAVGVAVIISLMITPKYTATATILPPNTQQEALLGLMAGGISSLQNLTGLSSILPGATTPSDLYAAILESGTIMGNIIKKYDLMRIFRTNTFDDAYKALRKVARISVSTEGIVSVSVTWYDKILAANIANSFIEELDKYNTETAMTVGKRYRIFIEKRLRETEDSLAKAEDFLRKFQETHSTIALDVELEAAIETIAKLKSQIIMFEAQKGAYASAGQADNPYLINIDNELRGLRRQLTSIEFGSTGAKNKEFGAGFSVPLSKMPEIAQEYARRLRDLKVQEAIFELMTQQYEQAKIMELKDTPTVQLLDKASPPEKKSFPVRSRIVMLSFMLGLILSVIASFFLESLEQLKTKPQEHNKWNAVYQEIRGSAVRLKRGLLGLFRK